MEDILLDIMETFEDNLLHQNVHLGGLAYGPPGLPFTCVFYCHFIFKLMCILTHIIIINHLLIVTRKEGTHWWSRTWTTRMAVHMAIQECSEFYCHFIFKLMCILTHIIIIYHLLIVTRKEGTPRWS